MIQKVRHFSLKTAEAILYRQICMRTSLICRNLIILEKRLRGSGTFAAPGPVFANTEEGIKDDMKRLYNINVKTLTPNVKYNPGQKLYT